MAALKINYEGNEYFLDLEDMDTNEARTIERSGVKNLKALEEGVGEGDVACLNALYWLMLVQNGEPGARIDRVSCKPIKFLRALGEASQEAAESGEEAPKEEPPAPKRRASRTQA